MNAQHSSASNEHYTPADIVERARRLLRVIDLDPATCAKANETVQAVDHFNAEENGFARNWWGRVFLNPPGGKCDTNGVTLAQREGVEGWFRPDGTQAKPLSSQKAWWFKLAREWYARRVESAIFVCFNLNLLQSTQSGERSEVFAALRDPIPLDFPICFPRDRVDYMHEKDGVLVPGGAPSHASAVVYLPPFEWKKVNHYHRFEEEFASLGRCLRGSLR